MNMYNLCLATFTNSQTVLHMVHSGLLDIMPNGVRWWYKDVFAMADIEIVQNWTRSGDYSHYVQVVYSIWHYCCLFLQFVEQVELSKIDSRVSRIVHTVEVVLHCRFDDVPLPLQVSAVWRRWTRRVSDLSGIQAAKVLHPNHRQLVRKYRISLWHKELWLVAYPHIAVCKKIHDSKCIS